MYRSSRWNAAPMQLDKENENRVFVSNVWGAREAFEPKEMEVDEVPVKSDIIEKTVPQPMIIDSEPKENTSALTTTKIFDAKASQAKRVVPFTAHPSDYSNHDRYWSYFKELPLVFSQWIHFLYTTSYILLVLYIMFQMVNGIYSDYQLKLQWFQNEILLENQRCSKNFQLNKCDPETRVPAVEDVCQAWEHCMLRDPLKVASTKITASVFAEILEEFVQNVSYKSIVCFTSI